MSLGRIVVDVCKENNASKLAVLIQGSQTFWTGIGYTLISNTSGQDIIQCFAGKNQSGVYSEGEPIYNDVGEVILVYQK